MRKYVESGLIALLVIVVLAFGAAFWYIRSGRFDLLLTRVIIQIAADYGARVEIGHLETNITKLGVKIKDIKVFPRNSKDPIAVVPERRLLMPS